MMRFAMHFFLRGWEVNFGLRISAFFRISGIRISELGLKTVSPNADFVIQGYLDPTEPLRDGVPFADKMPGLIHCSARKARPAFFHRMTEHSVSPSPKDAEPANR